MIERAPSLQRRQRKSEIFTIATVNCPHAVRLTHRSLDGALTRAPRSEIREQPCRAAMPLPHCGPRQVEPRFIASPSRPPHMIFGKDGLALRATHIYAT